MQPCTNLLYDTNTDDVFEIRGYSSHLVDDTVSNGICPLRSLAGGVLLTFEHLKHNLHKNHQKANNEEKMYRRIWSEMGNTEGPDGFLTFIATLVVVSASGGNSKCSSILHNQYQYLQRNYEGDYQRR